MAVERVIGVDFGTSTSVIRVKRYENGKPLGEKLDTKGVIFGNGMGEMVPTLIQRKDDDESVAYYGYAAQQKRRKHTTSHSFKVDLESSDPDKRALARKLTEEFLAFMGRQYRDQSDGSHLGSSDDRERTIISYPVKWSEETKQFMIAAAKKAGFPNVSGMDEAQAAIHAVTVMSEDHLRKNHLLVNGTPTNILLIDMGAGTTDLVLCRHTPGAAPKTEILTTWPKSGEILFGGREVDILLQGFFRDVMEPEDLAGALKSIGVDQFKAWKENSVSPALAKNDAVTDFFALDNYADIVGIEMDEYSLDRAGFEKCLGDYLKQLPQLINGCLESAGMNGGDVDLVIVTGGHSQWYFVQAMLAGKMPQFGAVDLPRIKADSARIIPISRPQETVALGLVYSPIQSTVPAAPSSISPKPAPPKPVPPRPEPSKPAPPVAPPVLPQKSGVFSEIAMRRIEMCPFPISVSPGGKLNIPSNCPAGSLRYFSNNNDDIAEILWVGGSGGFFKKKDGTVVTSQIDNHRDGKWDGRELKNCVKIRGYEYWNDGYYLDWIAGVTASGRIKIMDLSGAKKVNRDRQSIIEQTSQWDSIVDCVIVREGIIGITRDGSLKFAPASLAMKFSEVIHKRVASIYHDHVRYSNGENYWAILYKDGTVGLVNPPSETIKRYCAQLNNIVAVSFAGSSKSIKSFLADSRPSCVYALQSDGKLIKVDDYGIHYVMEDCIAFKSVCVAEKTGCIIAVNRFGGICVPDSAYKPSWFENNLKGVQNWSVI